MNLIELATENMTITLMLVIAIFGTILPAVRNCRQQRSLRTAMLRDQAPLMMTANQVEVAARCAVYAYTTKAQKLNASQLGKSPNAIWRDELEQIVKPLGGELLTAYNSSGVDFFVADFDKYKVLAIRGTEGLFDAFVDACALPTKAPLGGMVHSGFYRNSKIVVNAAKKFIEDDKPLIVCGHSMGAAMSIETSAILAEDGIGNVAGIVALCSPRSGNAEHAAVVSSTFKNRLLRVTYSRDVVAMVPPAPFYRHAGQTHYFDCQMEYHPHLTSCFRIVDALGAMMKDALKCRLLRNVLAYHSAGAVADMLILNKERLPLR